MILRTSFLLISILAFTGCTTVNEKSKPRVRMCPATKKINKTKLLWTKDDDDMITYAKRRCQIVYPSIPCLTKLVKRGKQNWYAECGRKR
jgi:hypothetical protein